MYETTQKVGHEHRIHQTLIFKIRIYLEPTSQASPVRVWPEAQSQPL